MDVLAKLYWIVVIFNMLLYIAIFVGFTLGIIYLIRRKNKKRGSLISSIKAVLIAYVIFAIIFCLIPGDMGFSFTFFFLPVFSVIALILLEVFKLFKK